MNTLMPGLGNMDFYAAPERLDGILPERLFIPTEPDEEPSAHLVTVDPNTKFRDESFGALLYRNDPWTITLVNRSAATFLKDVTERNVVFSLDNFLENSGAVTSQERRMVERLYRKLVRKKILISPNSTERR